MEIQLMYNLSDARCINKQLVDPVSYQGQMRDEVSIMNPVVMIEVESIPRYNYAYIPDLERYYMVDDITIYRDGLIYVTLSVDVLMSFKRDILSSIAVVDKQAMRENGDEYIDDGSLVTDNLMFTTITEYSAGFNDSVEYVLIVAG
jgi:hypothetical protein